MALMVIESPNKIKSLEKYSGMKVIATKGHFCDLPSNQLGVDLDNGYKMSFEYNPGAYTFLNQLKKLARNQDVYIATDPDREGFAIGQFVYNEIAKIAKSCHRTEINEITPTGVKKALASSLKFEDSNLKAFDAFLARRGSDRLVGFLMSGLANREILKDTKVSYSVGRVQSPAVRLVSDREKEIINFKTEDFYNLKVELVKGQKFSAQHANGRFDKKATADKALKAIKAAKTAKVTSAKAAEKSTMPRAPFTTVDLQAAASAQLGLPPTRTMRLAQDMFERGLVTYTRTDSIRMASSFVHQIRGAVEREFGAEYVPTKPIFRRSKNSQAEAHEAIRPTSMHNSNQSAPKVLGAGLTQQHLKLYNLIYKRAVASQMAPAIYNTQAYDLECGGEKLKATGRALKFDGFLKLWQDSREEKKILKEEDQVLQALPILNANDVITKTSESLTKGQTKPPDRFTEAALVKELESLGIGRPSTYASICQTIVTKQYAEINKRLLSPTETGTKLVEYLKEKHPWVVDYEMTKRLEAQLDEIDSSNTTLVWQDVLSEVHEQTGFINPKNKDELPISVNQIKYAKSLAEQTQMTLEPSVLENREELSAFIREAKKAQKATFQAQQDLKPLSTKQMEILETNGTTRVKNSVAKGDFGAGRRWLDKYFKQLNKNKPAVGKNGYGAKKAYKSKKTYKPR